MSKKITKSILFGLETLAILAILAFGSIALPIKADAQYGYDNGFSYTSTKNPFPTVYSISPNVGNMGDGPKTITITGSGFVPSSVARWNGSARPTTYIDSRHLLIQISANDLRGSRGRYVNVFNPAPGGGYSEAEFFTIEGYVAPTAPSIDPNQHLYDESNVNTYNNTNDNFYNSNQAQNNDKINRENSSALVSNAIFGSNSFLPTGITQWVLFAIIILIIVIIVRKLFGHSDRYHNSPLKHD